MNFQLFATIPKGALHLVDFMLGGVFLGGSLNFFFQFHLDRTGPVR